MTKARSCKQKRARTGIRDHVLVLVRQSLFGASGITLFAFAGSMFTGTMFDGSQSIKIFGVAALAILFFGVWFSLERYADAQIFEFNKSPKRRVCDDN